MYECLCIYKIILYMYIYIYIYLDVYMVWYQDPIIHHFQYHFNGSRIVIQVSRSRDFPTETDPVPFLPFCETWERIDFIEKCDA